MSINRTEYRVVGKNGKPYPNGRIYDNPSVAIEVAEECDIDVPGRYPHKVESRVIRIDDWQPYA